MMFKNRKGSTLALTLIIFAVLMIFAAFILNFMVTENKQAMYYQNKTQAYYLARSGADIVEEALVYQLTSYADDAEEVKKYLETYVEEHIVNLKLNDNTVMDTEVKIKYVDDLLLIESITEYEGITQTAKKVLYSTETIMSSTNEEITFSGEGQFIIYINEGKQHDNKGVKDIPSKYGRPAKESEKESFGVQDFDSIDWDNLDSSDGIIINDSKLPLTEYGNTDMITNLYINGPLVLEGDVRFIGDVNIHIKDSLTIKEGTKIISDKVDNNGNITYKLNIYVHKDVLGEYSVLTDAKVSGIDFTGNIYIKNGKVEFFLHQNTKIYGNIIYNGTQDFTIETQSNNNNLSKILHGSIYAPESTVYLGKGTDKVAFIIDGFIYAKNIHIYVKNESQAEKFYKNSNSDNSVSIPIKTVINTNSRSITYRSFYSD